MYSPTKPLTFYPLLSILIGESYTFKHEEDYEILRNDLKEQKRLIGINKFNNMFGTSIQPNDEAKRQFREENAYLKWKEGRF